MKRYGWHMESALQEGHRVASRLLWRHGFKMLHEAEAPRESITFMPDEKTIRYSCRYRAGRNNVTSIGEVEITMSYGVGQWPIRYHSVTIDDEVLEAVHHETPTIDL